MSRDESTSERDKELREAHALAGRALHRYQMQSHDVHGYREAINQALACLRREDYATARQILAAALDE